MNWRVLVVAVLTPSLALADPPLPSPSVVTYPPGDDKIVVLKKGDPAPYTGQLFDDNTALRWAVWLQQYKARYGIDMEAAETSCSVKVRHRTELAAIEKERTEKIEADLRARLKAADAARLVAEEELRNPGFFKQPGMWFGVGVVTAVVTAAVSVAVVNAAK